MDSDNINEILNTVGREEVPTDIQGLADETADRFRQTLTQPRTRGVFALGRLVAKGPVVKLAAAAAVVLAVLVAIGHVGGRNTTWAKVARNVDRAATYACDLTVTPSDPNRQTMAFKVAVHVRAGGDQEQAVYKYVVKNCSLSSPKGGTSAQAGPPKDNELQDMRARLDLRVGYALKDLGQLIKDLLARNRNKLAYYDRIEGRFVITAIHNPQLLSATFPIERGTARLWADTETNFPLRVEATVRGKNGEKLTLEAKRFVWNVPLDPRLFDPNISPTDNATE
jgi:outer membrane lipoprotein-sorting protein